MRTHGRGVSMRVLLLGLIPVLGLGGAVAIGLASQPRPAARAASTTIALPASLPTRFSFGVMDSPGDTAYLNGMRSANGTAWDYRYQYLAGGVNTGHGWETWNSPSGAFATYYMQDSANSGYMPGFVYYELLQSNGSCGSCGESARDLSNLANPSTMRAYYANWTLLMQKVGTFGKPALVIVEPDLWGFIEQAVTSKGNSASNQPASVASSGNADATGLPNTAQGYAWALLRIRDRYAPKAILALHASSWGQGRDIASDTDPTLNAASVGTQQAQFLNTAGLAGNPSGISSFNVVSNDIADHDSGQSGIWWDRNNVTFPNFARYLSYIKAVSTGTNRRVLMWQVPVGNQYFDTENNSAGHTQDNKAEYILGHIADFANAGVVGVLFGPGNGGTSAQDGRHDGITNPGPISTYECNQCDNHVSSYADDDGGYLRIFLGRYYTGGGYQLGSTVALSGTATAGGGTATAGGGTATAGGGTATAGGGTATAGSSTCQRPAISLQSASASPATVSPGSPVTLKATLTSSCAAKALVDFEVYDHNWHKVWQNAQDQQSLTGAAQTFQASWTTPASLTPGTYVVMLGVFSPGWGTLYYWSSHAATLTVSGTAATTSSAPTPTTAATGVPTQLSGVPCMVTLNGVQQQGTCTGTFQQR